LEDFKTVLFSLRLERLIMTRKLLALMLGLALGVGMVAVPAEAGGSLETIDSTGSLPSPIPGEVIAKVVGIKWDPRCVPVQYLMNDTLDPIPDPLGGPGISLADATTALQDSMDAWNNLRTSYIDMQIVGNVSNAGPRGFDMVNEQTFVTPPGFGAIASSPSTTLVMDSTLTDGTDIDGDGDSDVSNTISVCTDVDGDGDIEFPEGTYPAGTILDNDVQYNAALLRFTVDPAAADTTTNSVDLQGVATHELGHSHGLSHVLTNQISAGDGTAATMFPFIDTGDPASELAIRNLDTDDIAWSSFFYQEGSAASGPAAIQPGDLPFRFFFGVISGEAIDGATGGPISGASVSATRAFFRTVESSGFSGTTQLSLNPATGGLSLVSPAFNILDGNYEIPVPAGLYNIGIEAVDGAPVPAASVSLTAQIGSIFGQAGFNEEFYNGRREAAIEASPADSRPVLGFPGVRRSGIDITTNVDTTVAGFGSQDFVGFTGAAPDSYYAVAIPAADIAAADTGSGLTFHSGLFRTGVADGSVVPIWAQAQLTTCEVTGSTATVDLAHPLRKDNIFVAQDSDFAPFYFRRPERLGRKVLSKIASGSISHLCLVLQVPSGPFPGVSAFPPFIGLDGVPGGTNDVPITGLSFTSTDGVTFTASTTFNFMFGLVVSETP